MEILKEEMERYFKARKTAELKPTNANKLDKRISEYALVKRYWWFLPSFPDMVAPKRKRGELNVG